MNEWVLCVDDEPATLIAHRRFLEPHFNVETAADGAEALALLAQRGPFAVVVSDLQLPGISGIELLAEARVRHPDTVRLLLTGQADLESAIRAVNDGHVFRFLTKPCSPATFIAAVTAAAAQHQLIVSDRRRAELALRASEERYRQLFESNPQPMWVCDAQTHQFLAVNAAAVRHYGFAPNQFRDMTAQDIEAAEAADARPGVFLGHGHLRRHRHASGELRWVEVVENPIEFGGRPAVLVMAVDVTERMLLEEQLKQAQKLESIGQLAAGIAHEINTPIQYIGDNANFLAGAVRDMGAVLALYRAAGDDHPRLAEATMAAERADLDYLLDEAPRAIGQTLDGVKHVARIVRAMKEFAHPGAEEKTPLDLNHALETVVAVARNEWKYVAEVVTEFEPDLCPVLGLGGELNQVFLNLLVNAAHAIAASGTDTKGTITLTTRRVGAAVEVRVSDTGCGIPEAIRGRIFDPFFTTKPVGQGTGQGLAIAHAVVVTRHGGAIAVESEVGKGTTFTVLLPVGGSRLSRSELVRAAGAERVRPAARSGGARS